jgi:hypothetical protein
MSETPADPKPPDFVPVRDKKPLGMRPNTERAVREVLDRQRANLSPAYKDVARRNGISHRALKTMVSKVKNGEAVLGLPTDLEEMQIDAGVEMQRTLRLLGELEHFCNDALEGLLKQARHYTARGKVLAYRDLGIPEVIGDLKQIANLRRTKEEGYMAILEKVNRERQVKSAVADVHTEVFRSDSTSASLKAREALSKLQPATPAP